MCDCCDNKKGFLGGLILGMSFGAGLYFLFGTKKGKEIKEKIKEKGKFAVDNIGELLEDLQEKGQDLEEKAVQVAREVKEQVEEGVEKNGEIAREKIALGVEKAFENIEQVQDSGRKATERVHDITRRFFKNTPSPKK